MIVVSRSASAQVQLGILEIGDDKQVLPRRVEPPASTHPPTPLRISGWLALARSRRPASRAHAGTPSPPLPLQAGALYRTPVSSHAYMTFTMSCPKRSQVSVLLKTACSNCLPIVTRSSPAGAQVTAGE